MASSFANTAKACSGTSRVEQKLAKVTSGKKKVRDWRFEALRLICMYWIILPHMVSWLGWDAFTVIDGAPSWEGICINYISGYLAQTGVSLLMIMSGWFSYRVSHMPVTRVLITWSKCIVYSLIMVLMYRLALGHALFAAMDQTLLSSLAIKTMAVLPITRGQWWFMTAYIAVEIISPFLNKLIELLNRQQSRILIRILFVLVFIPRVFGASGLYSDLAYLSFCYLFGAHLHCHETRAINFKTALCVMLIAGVVAASSSYLIASASLEWRTVLPVIGLLVGGGGASPICGVVTAMALFTWFAGMCTRLSPQIGQKMGSVISNISPGTLGVYLLHGSPCGAAVCACLVRRITPPQPEIAAFRLLNFLAIMLVTFMSLLLISILINRTICRTVEIVVAPALEKLQYRIDAAMSNQLPSRPR